MDRNWWITNILIALIPSFCIILVCEVTRGEMEEYHQQQLKEQKRLGIQEKENKSGIRTRIESKMTEKVHETKTTGVLIPFFLRLDDIYEELVVDWKEAWGTIHRKALCIRTLYEDINNTNYLSKKHLSTKTLIKTEDEVHESTNPSLSFQPHSQSLEPINAPSLDHTMITEQENRNANEDKDQDIDRHQHQISIGNIKGKVVGWWKNIRGSNR